MAGGGEQLASWIVALLGVGAGAVVGQVREVYKDWSDSKTRKLGARRLLAHHATALADDALNFLSTAINHVGAQEGDALAVRLYRTRLTGDRSGRCTCARLG